MLASLRSSNDVNVQWNQLRNSQEQAGDSPKQFIIWEHAPRRLNMGSSCDEIVSVASDLLGFQGVEVSSATVIQNLWAGYGQIARVETDSETLIVKHIKPPASKTHTADEGHHRKMISYEVEQYFYSQLAPHLNQDAAVAKCFCSINKRSESSTKVALVLEDLRQRFPVAGEKRGELNPIQVHAALKWLAAFHGHFWANSKHLSREDMRRPPMEEINLAGSRTGVWYVLGPGQPTLVPFVHHMSTQLT